MMKLYGVKGYGSLIVEAVLRMSGLRYEVEFAKVEDIRTEAYSKINPLKQVPALKLPSGEIMTESLAITTYLNDIAGLGLVPLGAAPERSKYLRWSVFLVASIYPTFSFGDVPSRFVKSEDAQKELTQSSNEWRERMWLEVEKAAGSPWFLGEKMSLIDIYLGVMVYWRPGRDWFKANAPKIIAIADRLEETAAFKEALANNK